MTNPQLTSYSITKGENFFSKIRHKTRVPTFVAFTKQSISSPSWISYTGKRNKRQQNWKEVKLSLFAGDRMPHVTCIGNPNKSTKTRINEFSRVARYKIHTQKLTHFYILITRPEEKLGKQLHL